MREILFRGKTMKTGEWVIGSLFFDPDLDRAFIESFDYPGDERTPTNDEVVLKTVGQYTGLGDRNGLRIFEGDIVRVTDGADEMSEYEGDTGIGKVEFYGGLWYVDGGPDNALFDLDDCGYIEVIGNRYDNPELMEE